MVSGRYEGEVGEYVGEAMLIGVVGCDEGKTLPMGNRGVRGEWTGAWGRGDGEITYFRGAVDSLLNSGSFCISWDCSCF